MKHCRKLMIAAGLALFAGPGAAGPLTLEVQGQLLLHEKRVQQCAYCALKKNSFGRGRLAVRREQAFWVLSTDSGLQCDFWDDGQATANTAYTLGVPANAVALFHTHPAGMTSFSAMDWHEAFRLELEYGQGIAFYALAGRKFGIIDPATREAGIESWSSSTSWLGELSRSEKNGACNTAF